MVAHIYADGTKWNFTGVSMRAGLTDLLVGKYPTQYLGQGLFIAYETIHIIRRHL